MRFSCVVFYLSILFFKSVLIGSSAYAQSLSECAPLSLSQVQANEDLLQVNAVKIGRYFISHSMDSYFIAGRTMLPISQVADAIGLNVLRNDSNIELSHAQSTCELQIFLNESPFNIGLNTAKSGQMLWTQDEFDTYLDVVFLETLFDGEVNIDYSEQLVHIQTELEIKPIGESKSKPGTSFSSIKPDFFIADQYHLSTFPSADINLSYNYDDESSQNNYDARLNAYFDSFYQSTELRLNHNDNDSFQRLKFSRDFRVGVKKAPVSNIGYELGDIFTTQDNLVNSTNLGSGFHLYTGSKNQFNSFNSISIQETVSPGWRGELYRNGQFVSAQSVNLENQLIFNDVPAFFGSNRYELRLFGPDGQQETRTKTYQMGKEQQVKDKFDIELFSVEPGKNFIDEDNNGTLPYTRASKVGVSYGFSQDLTAGLSVQSLDNNTTGDSQDYITASLYKQVGPGAFNFELGTEMGEGVAVFGGYSGYWLDQYNVSVDVSHFDSFSSQIRSESADLESQLRARISGSSSLWGGLGWNASLAQQFNRETDDNLQALFSTTKAIRGGAISSSFSYNQKEGLNRTFNNLYWVQNFDIASISVGLNWFPFDDFDIRSSNIEARWATDSRLFQISRFRYQPDSVDKYSLNHQLNWRTPHFTLTSGVTINDSGDWEFRAGFVTSIGYDYVNNKPRFSHKKSSNTGNLHLLSFLDRDRNGTLSAGDKPLPNIKFAGNSDWRHSETNQYGQAVLMGASTSGQQHVAIDLASLRDPFLFPKYEKLAVKTHPGGLNRIMLPVLSFSDIEGSVYLKGKLGSRPVMGVPILLMQGEELVAKSTTESDGYYAFSRVSPGQYAIQISKEYLGKKHWVVQTMPSIINVSEQGDIIWLSDLILGDDNSKARDKSGASGAIEPSQGNARQYNIENQFFVQIGVFKKARSANVILNALPNKNNNSEFQTNLFRNGSNGVTYIAVGPYGEREQAQQALNSIKSSSRLSSSFVVLGSKYSGSEFEQQKNKTNLEQTASTSSDLKQTRLKLLQGKNLCQLGSYGDVSNIDMAAVQKDDNLVVTQKIMNNLRYYTLLRLPPEQFDRTERIQLQNSCEKVTHLLTGNKGWWRVWAE